MRTRKQNATRGDPLLDYRRRFKGVLDALGCRGLFEAMPAHVRDQLIRPRDPEPTLAFDAACPADAEFAVLRETLTRAFRAARVDADDGTSMRVVDFLWILPWLANAGVDDGPGTPRVPPACTRFFDAMRPRAAAWLELVDGVWLALHAAVSVPLVERSRLDGRLYYVAPGKSATPRGGQAFTIHVRAEPAQMTRVTLDGEPRPAWRVGSCNEWDAVRWLTWTHATVGRDGGISGDGALPVYAQSHALRQLRSRVDLPTYADWLEYWLHASLASPTIVERQSNGDLLVEYRVHEHRLGYVVVTPLADCCVVRTFLFLTMEGTPEARQLARQLRLRRDDVTWLGLHELSAFTRTDLAWDETLRPMLEACGCGHLFDLGDLDAAPPTPRAFAGEVKRYLRLAA